MGCLQGDFRPQIYLASVPYGTLSIYSTDLCQGVSILIFGDQSIGRIERADGEGLGAGFGFAWELTFTKRVVKHFY